MPTALLVLLAMVPILWLAFCILKAQFGLVCGTYCSATLILTDIAAITWLILQGQTVMNGTQFGFACLVLFTVNLGLSVGWLSGYLKRRRLHDKEVTDPPS